MIMPAAPYDELKFWASRERRAALRARSLCLPLRFHCGLPRSLDMSFPVSAITGAARLPEPDAPPVPASLARCARIPVSPSPSELGDNFHRPQSSRQDICYCHSRRGVEVACRFVLVAEHKWR